MLNKFTKTTIGLAAALAVLAGCDSGGSGGTPSTGQGNGSDEVNQPITLTPIDVSAAALVTGASKSGTSGSDTKTEFDFPSISTANGGMEMTIPNGSLPEFPARRTLTAGTGQSVEFGDAVVIKYDMFSWTSGQLTESSTQLEGPFAVRAGVSDNIPEYLAKSLLGRRLGEKMQVVFPAGMDDLPEYLDQSDAYVLVMEIL